MGLERSIDRWNGDIMGSRGIQNRRLIEVKVDRSGGRGVPGIRDGKTTAPRMDGECSSAQQSID